MSTEAPSLPANPLDAVGCYSKTDIGQKREENQDSFGSALSDEFKFFFVCDGMGGVKGGAVASQLAVSVIESACKDLATLDSEAIRSAVADANARIFERGTNDEQLSGMGTTFVGLAFIKNRMLITSVGDSRAYRIRDGEITQLTEDHTLVMELLRSGSITEEQAINHPVSHMLTRSLGPAPEIEIDCWESPEAPCPGDKYLLCSDGLYNMLGLEELGEVILSLPPEEAVEELISLANLRGGHDNITVMLVSLDESYPQPSSSDSPYGDDRLALDEAIEHDTAFSPLQTEGDGSGKRRIDETLQSRARTDKAGTSARPTREEESNGRIPQGVGGPRGNNENDQRLSASEPTGSTQMDSTSPKSKVQAKFLVALCVALAGSYLLGHLHGASDEESSMLAHQSEQSAFKFDARPGRSSGEQLPIAVAPRAIQPRNYANSQADSDKPRGDSTPLNVVANGLANGSAGPSIVSPSVSSATMMDHPSEDRGVELRRTVADLEQKLAAFRQPITGQAADMLKASSAQIERISRDLDTTRTKIDSSTRALTIWLGRKKRLQTGDPINLASEVAISSEQVKAKQDAFNQVTYMFLQENEVLRFNPGDKAREKRVADLARDRLAAMRELIESVRIAIQDELSKVEKQIETNTLLRVDLEAQLEQSRRDVEYVKALAGSDPRARESKQLELQRLLDVARAELDELSRSGQ